MRHLILTLVLTATARAEDEKIFSGPQLGEKLTSFKAVGVFDDQEGKERDFIKEAGGKPVLLIFVHEISRPSASLMRGLSAYAASREKDGLKTCVVWLSADRTETVNTLKRARMGLSLKSLVLISLDGIEGPGAYGLNRKVGLTILLSKENKVTANFALTQPAVSDGPKVLEALCKLIGGKPPELKAFEELAFGRPASPMTDPKLGNLLRAVINKKVSEEDVKKAAAEVEEYVGKDPAKQKEVARISGVIVEKEYGTEAARKQAKAWVEKYGKRP